MHKIDYDGTDYISRKVGSKGQEEYTLRRSKMLLNGKSLTSGPWRNCGVGDEVWGRQ